jgi:glutaredoxin 3
VSAVTIYTTRMCPYCHAALALLRSKRVEFENVDVSGDQEKRAWLAEKSGRTTVPQVFVNEVAYGGYTDLVALERSGRLDGILKGT